MKVAFASSPGEAVIRFQMFAMSVAQGFRCESCIDIESFERKCLRLLT